MRYRALLVPVAFALGCAHAGSAGAPPRPAHHDEHSFATGSPVRVSHVALDLTLDFAAKLVTGSAELTLVPSGATTLVLDTKDLKIQAVTAPDGSTRAWTMGTRHPALGEPLTIQLRTGDAKVRIAYQTSPGAEALQWLAPEQTRDRKQPFLFTQGEAIYTRSWIPLQDSPDIRVTYEAVVRAPKELTVVMSAEQLGRGPDGAWRFRMPQAIPPYLIALGAGDLAFQAISARSGIWAEPSLVKAAADELADTEAMIKAAEDLFGPYRWGRYDVLILPPAFPFGGMENPRLTFATPTILAGDRSLVSLVAHELAHSWSGNLVTNATWRDFWLNEGFTVYFQDRIMERVFGEERARLERQLGRQELEKEMTSLEPWQQVLHVELKGRHPDDAFSSIPYMKGALFLRRLEAAFGRAAFDRFLRRYFDSHAFRSITTEDFVAWLQAELFATDRQKAATIDLDTWLHKPGLPADAPRDASPALALVDEQRQRFVDGTPAKQLVTKGWVTQQWQHFIETLPDAVPLERLAELDRTFGFTASQNSEILCDWLTVAIRRNYRAADARLSEFLMAVGRRKFLKPLYTELAKTPAGLERARAIYTKARPRYHAVSSGTIDKILKWSPG